MSFYTHDNVIDSPINNFGTFNPLNKQVGSPVYSNGNLLAQDTGNNVNNVPVTCHFPRIEGCKWYAEFYYYEGFYDHGGAGAPISFVVTSDEKDSSLGIYSTDGPEYFAGSKNSWHQYRAHHNTMPSHSYPVTVNYGLVGILFDYELNKIQFSINGNWCSEIFPMDSNAVISGINLSGKYNLSGSDSLYVRVFHGGGDRFKVAMNCGQDHSFGGTKTGGGAYTDANGIGQFYYEPPEGALSLCTANIPSGPIDIANDDVPSDYMKTALYTGNGGTQSITSVGFQPDLIWCKNHTTSGANHRLFDSVRGASSVLYSSLTNAAATDATGLTSFDSTGFSIGANQVNDNNAKFVAWCWKAAGAPANNQARIIDTDGSLITKSTADLKNETSASITPAKVSANRKSGFSIVKHTGTGSAATVPHGLSSAPDFIIVKNTTDVVNWIAWHTNLNGGNKLIEFNLTNALKTSTTPWNGTIPSSSVISLGTNNATNGSGDSMICYAWHSVAGYSKFGSYVGNGSADGPFVYTGFKPAWVMVKATNLNGSSWFVWDNQRSPYNEMVNALLPNDSMQELTDREMDFLSNGFKPRANDGNYNQNYTYIYAAFAESPFNAPATAR